MLLIRTGSECTVSCSADGVLREVFLDLITAPGATASSPMIRSFTRLFLIGCFGSCLMPVAVAFEKRLRTGEIFSPSFCFVLRCWLQPLRC